MSEPVLIGIDCATEPARMGFASARIRAERLHIDAVCSGASCDPATWIAEQVGDAGIALLALDAPLGWPAALGNALAAHQAGRVLSGKPNDLFRRATDRFIDTATGKRPLDVGADRIARTAWAALDLLQRAAALCRRPVTLAWSPGTIAGLQAIEVYPAATLRALGLPDRSYKLPDQRECREAILQGLSPRLLWGCEDDIVLRNADCLDAIACLVAAQAFLQGRCYSPADAGVSPLQARREGWIWVPRSEHGQPDVG